MPAPQGSMLANLTKLQFTAQGNTLPMDWQDQGDQYDQGFDPSELTVAPNPPDCLFQAATLNKYHVDTAKDAGDKLATYIDGICDAICSGIGNWMSSCAVAGVIINGPVGVMVPGNLTGPPLAGFILPSAPMATAQEIAYSNAIANAFGTAWLSWSSLLMGQLPYPAFAAVPSPVAPPAPNVPMPLIAFSSGGEVQLSASMLKMAMDANFGDPTALHASNLFDALSKAFAQVFITFKSSTMIQNVMGTGPVPVFAPPFVPVGPVVGGVGNGAAVLV